MYTFSMENVFQKKIADIEKVINASVLMNAPQNNPEIKDYYIKNRLAYRLFHNSSGYLHMGISERAEYDERDLEVAVEEISQTIKKNNYSTILELGSGRGANSFYIAKRNPDVKITAVDLSINPLIKYKNLSNVKFIKGDFHDLGFISDQSLDLVFGIETFCHSNDKKKLFSEIHRILKPGGRLYVLDGYRTEPIYKNNIIEKSAVLVEYGMAVSKFETLDNFETEVLNSGFSMEVKVNLSQNVLPTMKGFESKAKRFFKHPLLAKITSNLFPEKFIRNSVAGYLMVPLVEQGMLFILSIFLLSINYYLIIDLNSKKT